MRRSLILFPVRNIAAPGPLSLADTLPAVSNPKKKAKKKARARTAWISFAGRIVAQLTGAVATIVLGVVILHKAETRRPGAGSSPAADASTAPRAAGSPTRPHAPRSLAVLPLQNFSADPAQAYVADGLTEALVSGLAQVKGLRVISRTSSTSYKGQSKPLPVIARELGADLVVEGSVTRAGRRLRVTAQLIDAGTDEHLWARSYERTDGDVLALQATLAAAIVSEVDGVLRPLVADGRGSPVAAAQAP